MRTSLQSCMTCARMVTGICIALHAAKMCETSRGHRCKREALLQHWLIMGDRRLLKECAWWESLLSIIASAHLDGHLHLWVIAAAPVGA